MGERRYRPRSLGEPTITRDSLAAHVAASLYAVLHNEAMSDEQKLAAMHALAALVRDLDQHWQRTRKFWGLGSQRLLYRLAGLDMHGQVPVALLRRIAEVSIESEGHIERGEN